MKSSSGRNAVPEAVQPEEMMSLPVMRNMSMSRSPHEIATYAKLEPTLLDSVASATGSQGRLSARPSSAPAARTKTERYRETGELRWPPTMAAELSPRSLPPAHAPITQLTQSTENLKQTLWIRSLRAQGVPLMDLMVATGGASGLTQLQKEWLEKPLPPGAQMPFCGATASKFTAVRTVQDPGHWIERPVSTGTLSLSHFGGNRYTWDQTPREVCNHIVPKEAASGQLFTGPASGKKAVWDW